MFNYFAIIWWGGSNNILYPKEDKEQKILLYACRNCDHQVSFYIYYIHLLFLGISFMYVKTLDFLFYFKLGCFGLFFLFILQMILDGFWIFNSYLPSFRISISYLVYIQPQNSLLYKFM